MAHNAIHHLLHSRKRKRSASSEASKRNTRKSATSITTSSINYHQREQTEPFSSLNPALDEGVKDRIPEKEVEAVDNEEADEALPEPPTKQICTEDLASPAFSKKQPQQQKKKKESLKRRRKKQLAYYKKCFSADPPPKRIARILNEKPSFATLEETCQRYLTSSQLMQLAWLQQLQTSFSISMQLQSPLFQMVQKQLSQLQSQIQLERFRIEQLELQNSELIKDASKQKQVRQDSETTLTASIHKYKAKYSSLKTKYVKFYNQQVGDDSPLAVAVPRSVRKNTPPQESENLLQETQPLQQTLSVAKARTPPATTIQQATTNSILTENQSLPMVIQSKSLKAPSSLKKNGLTVASTNKKAPPPKASVPTADGAPTVHTKSPATEDSLQQASELRQSENQQRNSTTPSFNQDSAKQTKTTATSASLAVSQTNSTVTDDDYTPQKVSQQSENTTSTSTRKQPGFQTAGSRTNIAVTTDSLQQASRILQTDTRSTVSTSNSSSRKQPPTASTPVFVGFQTAGSRSNIAITNDSLQQASRLLQTGTQNVEKLTTMKQLDSKLPTKPVTLETPEKQPSQPTKQSYHDSPSDVGAASQVTFFHGRTQFGEVRQRPEQDLRLPIKTLTETNEQDDSSPTTNAAKSGARRVTLSPQQITQNNNNTTSKRKGYFTGYAPNLYRPRKQVCDTGAILPDVVSSVASITTNPVQPTTDNMCKPASSFRRLTTNPYASKANITASSMPPPTSAKKAATNSSASKNTPPLKRGGGWVSNHHKHAQDFLDVPYLDFAPTAPQQKRPSNAATRLVPQSSNITKKNPFRYEEVVRNKAERENMQRQYCPDCGEFADAVLDGEGAEHFKRQHLLCHSRHRTVCTPSDSPAEYWLCNFQDSERREQEELRQLSLKQQQEEEQQDEEEGVEESPGY